MALFAEPRAVVPEDDFPRIAVIDDQTNESGDDPPAIRAVDRLHDSAIRLKASDIHLEPTRDGGRVRLRVDGILHESEHLARDLFHPIVSRVKLLAG